MNKSYWILILFAVTLRATAGGSFIDLGFDDADISGPPFFGDHSTRGTGTTSALLPGWTLSLGTHIYPTISLNSLPTDPITFAGLGDYTTADALVIDGLFALKLIRGDTNGPVWTLEQSGAIPSNAQYFAYKVSRGSMEVRVNDQVLQPVAGVLVYPSSTNLVYDVSSFAGQ